MASGEPVTVRVRSRFHRRVTDPMVGILIRTRIGMDVYGTNTRIEQIELGRFAGRATNSRSISASSAGSRRSSTR